MKNIIISIIALIGVATVSFSASAAPAPQSPKPGCSSQTVCQNGRCVSCTTCCVGNVCNTQCY